MSIGHVNPALAARLPLEQIAEICQRYGVSQLSVYGLGPEERSKREEEPLFLVTFHNDDFGPWGSKLDELENDISGVMHEKVHVASRRGIEQSSPPRRDRILATAQPIYEF
jgi:predicted nucleotidyltransferase